MFEDEDLRKAEILQDTGRFLDVDLIELAEKIYVKRKQNPSETSKPFDDGN